jgi:hypothetical protein
MRRLKGGSLGARDRRPVGSIKTIATGLVLMKRAPDRLDREPASRHVSFDFLIGSDVRTPRHTSIADDETDYLTDARSLLTCRPSGSRPWHRRRQGRPCV